MNKGQRVQCTGSCGSLHTGTVAAVIVPGVLVGVSWDGYVASPVRGTPEARAMKALTKAHGTATVAVAALVAA